jgi:BirA family transcriptional regulator, biotin operon repressor / biotin---[acetyl-CoA-carboxylase] ligase
VIDGFYDGIDQDTLAAMLNVPLVRTHAITESTQDDVHRLAAAGAPAGTIVLAEEQTAGRGRSGRKWTSGPGDGIWLSLLERPANPEAIEVLSLRAGLHAARALDVFAPSLVRLKWPNDLYIDDRKLAGILIEARWRADTKERGPDWVTIGIGVNVRSPAAQATAAALRPGTSRLAALDRLVPALRAAARGSGALDAAELAEYRQRDLARGRTCSAPERGVVEGISPGGALIVLTSEGRREYRGGSLILESESR